MLSEEEKQKRLENYRKKKEKLLVEETKTKEKKESLLAKIKTQRENIKKSEEKQKRIRTQKDLELIKMLRDMYDDEEIDDLLLETLGVSGNIIKKVQDQEEDYER